MKVLAADGYILCRGLVRTLTLLRDDVCIIAANSIDEVLARISESPDLDLVLLDAGMPGMEHFAGVRRTADKLPAVPVVVTSSNESDAHIAGAIRSGAKGYFSVSTKPYVLEYALLLILSGECYVPARALRLGPMIVTPQGFDRGMPPGNGSLTRRQREIIVKLAEGKSNKEIARELTLLEGTVKLHVKGILRKLGVRNRTEAVVAAARSGYLPNGALGIGVPEEELTAEALDGNGKMSRPRRSSLPAQLGAGNMRHASGTRMPRSGRARDRQTDDQTTVAEEASSGQLAATAHRDESN
jgi:DNA-binding NarL/FixJ family response regulator